MSLAHPYNSRYLREVCKCWMELRLGKASNSSQYPPIVKSFKRVRQSNPYGRRVNFWHLLMSNSIRECNCCRSGIDSRLGHSVMLNSERYVHDCSPVGRTSTPHDITKLQRRDTTPCILGKDLTFGQYSTSNFSRERRVCSVSSK